MANKVIFYFVFFLIFSQSVNAVALVGAYLGHQAKIQNDRNFQKAISDREASKQPLISLLMKNSALHWDSLIDLGFLNNSFTVADAHWAIEQYQTRENQKALQTMLNYKSTEYLLTESFRNQGNLLYFVLTHGYDDAFSLIKKAFPRLEANPAHCLFQGTLGSPFRRALAQQQTYPSTTLIEHLLADNDANNHEALVGHGLLAQRFTNRDLLWVIDQYEKPEKISKEIADSIFGHIFDPENESAIKAFVIRLLKQVDLPKESSYVTQAKTWLYSHSHSELRNILAECVERAHLRAFSEILAVFPDLIKELSSFSSVERLEYFKGNNWIGTYEKAQYNLLSWLLRDRGSEKHVYLQTPLAKPHYVSASQILCTKYRAAHELENPKTYVDPDFFQLIQVNARQNQAICDKLDENKRE